jgi:hypothetical protein
MDKRIPSMQVGKYTKYINSKESMSIYRDGFFIAAIENTTASCDLIYKMATEISELEKEKNVLKQELLNIKVFCEALRYSKPDGQDIQIVIDDINKAFSSIGE